MENMRIVSLIFLAVLLTFMASTGEAQQKFRTEYLQAEAGEVIFLQTKPASAKKANLLLLPGVNRSFMDTDISVKTLAKVGFGIATFAFSAHPASVAALPEGVVPSFYTKGLSLDVQSKQVRFVHGAIKERGLLAAVPITLSYTGAVSPQLEGYPLIIDVAPMTSSAAANPELDENIRRLKAAEVWNPIFGPFLTRNVLDGGYRSHYSGQVDSY
ncbi:MAG: hypothetical protein N2578_06120, partial [Bdellovibrionaceae bacterium]|nr:hypothetical protein [Pseudobdellovibrionaceae bacterium]